MLVGGVLFYAPDEAAGEFSSLHGILAIAAIPAFCAGFLEDITKRVGVMPRLVATMTSGAVFALLTGIWLDRLDLPLVDSLLPIAVIGIPITAFAVAGVANAINIIDGFNGLAGGVGVIIHLAIAAVAASVGDAAIVQLALLGAAALLGFLLVNFPRGALFMGDGGAYLIGFFLAQLAVLLVVRNPEISPWAMAAIFCFPLAETTFSILRRVRNKRHPGHPDRVHLHSLVHARLVKRFVAADVPAYVSNALVAPLLWVLALLPALLAVQWPYDTSFLMVIAFLFCVLYNAIYARLACFRWCWRRAFGFRARSLTAAVERR